MTNSPLLRFEDSFELFQRLGHFAAQIAVQFAFLQNVGEHVRVPRLDKGIELLLVFLQRCERQLIDEAVSPRKDDQNLFLDRQRLILPLLEQFD